MTTATEKPREGKTKKQTVCPSCGRAFRPLPKTVMWRSLDAGRISEERLQICPDCRRRRTAESVRLRNKEAWQ